MMHRALVNLKGFEPFTSSMQTECLYVMDSASAVSHSRHSKIMLGNWRDFQHSRLTPFRSRDMRSSASGTEFTSALMRLTML